MPDVRVILIISVIFKHMLGIIFTSSISCEITLRWISENTFDDKSTLVQVMAWCHQATSPYLSQCWLRSMLPYDVTRPQWVKVTLNQRKLTLALNFFYEAKIWFYFLSLLNTEMMPLWKTTNHLSCIINTIVANDLVTQKPGHQQS